MNESGEDCELIWFIKPSEFLWMVEMYQWGKKERKVKAGELIKQIFSNNDTI